MSEFFVGQKVVRVGIGAASEDETTTPCVIGEIYTVRWVGKAIFKDVVGRTNAVRIHERVRMFSGDDAERWYDFPYFAGLFQPLESKAIAVFRRIARDVTEGKKVRIDA